MGNTLFNIRFGTYHLQVTLDPIKVTFRKNYYWTIHKYRKFFHVYCWFGKHNHAYE